MRMHRWFALLLALTGTVFGAGSRTPAPASSGIQADGEPDYDGAVHGLGRLRLWVSNDGSFNGAEYPKGSYKFYLSGANLVIGAVQGGDTLVVQSFEPAAAPHGKIIETSSMDPNLPWYDSTSAHQDCMAIYYDTCTNCGNYHPLNVEVRERSRSWVYEYAQDLVLFDYAVKNVGSQRLSRVYIGVYADGDVMSRAPGMDPNGADDDMVGLLEKFPATYLPDGCPPDTDAFNIAWTADNDGNMRRPQQEVHLLDITGLMFIRTPRDSETVTFNWWSGSWRDEFRNFGPQKRITYRPLVRGGLGVPYTNEEWYHFLSNGERDYDQAFQSTMLSFDPDWVLPPEDEMDSVLTGLDPRYMVSVGPFGLDPGQTIKFTTAFVAGKSFHRYNYIDRLLPYDPYGWYQHVYFDQLARNAMWAKWIYDNPGIDTDGDGYAGEFLICHPDDSVWKCDTLVDTTADPDTSYELCRWDYGVGDTVWRSGDGVPDFRGAFPPPNPAVYNYVNENGDTIPALRVYPEVGKIRLVWNGAATEATIDPFSHQYDFEGYAVYLAHDSRPSSFGLVTTYDKENWFRWTWNTESRSFVCAATPYTLGQLRCTFAGNCNDTTWRPEFYTRDNPLIIPGGPKVDPRVYYFEPCGANRSIMADNPLMANSGIKRVYPDAPAPPFLNLDSLDVNYPDRSDTTYFTPDGFLKYYEYEYVFDGLLATVPYYVNVTAFDHGYPGLGLAGLEGDPSSKARAVYPLPSSEVIAAEGLEVFVYPNPYRIDEDYLDRGYEGIGKWHISDPDKKRLVHFANLPPKCTISIFTLNGDLVRELHHDGDPNDYLANHATWDLINKNFQLVVSGLYYWVVEDDQGNSQVGKLVVIM